VFVQSGNEFVDARPWNQLADADLLTVEALPAVAGDAPPIGGSYIGSPFQRLRLKTSQGAYLRMGLNQWGQPDHILADATEAQAATFLASKNVSTQQLEIFYVPTGAAAQSATVLYVLGYACGSNYGGHPWPTSAPGAVLQPWTTAGSPHGATDRLIFWSTTP